VRRCTIASVFVDTNVFIYALDPADLQKHESARLWQAELWKRGDGRVSYQVLQEFYSNVVKKWPALRQQARSAVRELLVWQPVVVDGQLIERAWNIQDRYQLSFWDSLIVAAAKVAACRYLLTEDLQAGQDIDGITVINPFRRSPATLPSN
jgi:predicted nucleic acid-binding protein